MNAVEWIFAVCLGLTLLATAVSMRRSLNLTCACGSDRNYCEQHDRDLR